MEARPADDALGETQAAPAAAPAPEPQRAGMFSPGEVLLGRFRIVRLIGRGGMGEVYEAEDMELGRVALKTVRSGLATSEMSRLFRQEVQIARKVSGPNVCRIHELFTLPATSGHAATAFLTMEYMDGETLAERLHAGPLPPKAAQQIALELCAGLKSIHHAGVLHRDLKARNVMLVRRGEETVAVVTDFGLALSLSSEEVRSGGHGLAGTPDYMSPEQFTGDALTPAADIYALGVLFYEMATGSVPFHAHTPLEAAASRARQPTLRGIPYAWREVVHRCLKVDPAERYQSADEVAAALRRSASPVKLATHDTAMFARRFRIALLLLAVAGTSVAAFFVVRRMSLHVPPAEAVRWYAKGVEALREGTDVKAVHALQFATQRDPHFAMAHARLAEAWSELDFASDADQEMLLANAYAEQQRMTARDRQTLAAVQATLTRDYPTAEARYRDLADNAPDEEKAASLVDLGRAQEKAGKMQAALATYQKAALRGPDQPAPFVHIGILESRSLHKTQAQAAFAQAEKLYRADANREGLAEIEYQQGYLSNQQSDAKSAFEHLNNALAEARTLPSKSESGNPADVQLEIRVLTQLSTAASTDRDPKQAADYANQAIALANTNGLQTWAADGWVRLADSYIESGDDTATPKAEQALETALQLARNSQQRRVEAEASLAMANLRQSDPQQAIVYAQAAFDYYKQNSFREGMIKSAILLARSQRDMGSLDAAMQSGEELLKLTASTQDKSLEAYGEDLVASVWLAKEEYPRALAMYQQALADGGNSMRPYEAEGAARALAGLGRYKDAEAMLPMIKGAQNVAALHVLMLLSQLKYKDAAAEIDQSMAGMGKADWSQEMLLLAAVAYAHTGRLADAQADLAAVKVVTPPDKAELALASAEVAQQQGNAAQSREQAESALAYFRSVGARDSALHAAVLTEESTTAAPSRLNNSSGVDNFELDTLKQIEQSWSPADYASFAARPDIARIARVSDKKD
jgi:tetratricopeptide (TPR) repeat protein